MLIEFRVENHRSLRDEQALTMEAGRVGDADDKRPRSVSGYADQILPVAAIYGANASGKSNVLSALAWMRNVVVHSQRSWEPDEGVPREPFAWGPKKDEPSLFEATILVDSVRYQYGFLANSQSFIEEWLYAWPHGKKQVWYERDNSDFKFGENLKGENKVIMEVTRSNALFLSAAVQLKHAQLYQVFSWFRDLRLINMPISRNAPGTALGGRTVSPVRIVEIIDEMQQPTLFSGEPERLSDRFRDMLRNADIGIVEMRAVRTEAPDDLGRDSRTRIQLKHKNSHGDAWLPLEEESQGTQKLFHMALPVIVALREGNVLVVDELEASLHPSLAQEIVSLFNNPSKNPNNAQLIFSTHDTNLLGTTLGEPALRRDQVWLTEKDSEGGTVLYPLTDYKPRKSENLERGYLQGRYGAIPFLGKFAWATEESSNDQTPRSGAEASQTPRVSGPQATGTDSLRGESK
jgi:AAA15 family ATPase/GTPase